MTFLPVTLAAFDHDFLKEMGLFLKEIMVKMVKISEEMTSSEQGLATIILHDFPSP